MTQGPERRGNGVAACFPVSIEAVKDAFDFFDRPNPLDAHTELTMQMLAENRPTIIMLMGLQAQWQFTDEMQIGFNGGAAFGYKMLDIQAKKNGSTIPQPSETVIATYAADLNQLGTRTVGPYVDRRTDELELEDPNYHKALFMSMLGHVEAGMDDRAYFTMMGGIMLYDIIKKEAYAQDLAAQFEA